MTTDPEDITTLWSAADALVDIAQAPAVEGENIRPSSHEQHIHAPAGYRIDIQRRDGEFRITVVSEGWLRRGML